MYYILHGHSVSGYYYGHLILRKRLEQAHKKAMIREEISFGIEQINLFILKKKSLGKDQIAT